jgi:hypothetical protein
VHRADNLTTFMYRFSSNLAASNSKNRQGLSWLVQGSFYLYSLSMGLNGLQRRFGPFGEGRDILPPSVIEPKLLAFPVQRLRYFGTNLFLVISSNGPQDCVVKIFNALVQCFQTEQRVAQCDGRVENEGGWD